jgi:hypothetical protein
MIKIHLNWPVHIEVIGPLRQSRWICLQGMVGVLEIDLLYSSSFVPFSSVAQNFVFEIPWNVLVLLVIRNSHVH